MSRKWSSNDGVIFAEWEVTSDGRLLRKMIQPTEDRILSSNDELRKSPDALKRLEWGEWIGATAAGSVSGGVTPSRKNMPGICS